jgi:hypothetical protein
MSFITFGGGRQLYIDISAPTMIGCGAGVHQLWFPLQLDARRTISGGVSVSLTGHAWIWPSRHDYLGPWTTAEAVATFEDQRIPANIVRLTAATEPGVDAPESGAPGPRAC